MNLLIISRDQELAARIGKVYAGAAHTVMVIPSPGWFVHKRRVPQEPHLVLYDVADEKPNWPRVVANLQRTFGLKVVVVDFPGSWRRANTAYDHLAVGYMSKAKSVSAARIRETIEKALRAGLN